MMKKKQIHPISCITSGIGMELENSREILSENEHCITTELNFLGFRYYFVALPEMACYIPDVSKMTQKFPCLLRFEPFSVLTHIIKFHNYSSASLIRVIKSRSMIWAK
jgi:hypothetical protein